MIDLGEMLVTMAEMARERDRIDAELTAQLRAQQRERSSGEVTAVLVAPMVDVGGVMVRARPTVFVAPGLLAPLPMSAPTVPRSAIEALRPKTEDATDAALAAEV